MRPLAPLVSHAVVGGALLGLVLNDDLCCKSQNESLLPGGGPRRMPLGMGHGLVGVESWRTKELRPEVVCTEELIPHRSRPPWDLPVRSLQGVVGVR